MTKISKRESIILSIAAVTVLCGAYALIPAKTAASVAGNGPVSQAPADLLANVGKDASAVDAYIVSWAETEWNSDPFSGRSNRTAYRTTGMGHKRTGFSYTCYLEMGDRRMAVINGMEYRAGDPLEMEGYALVSIHPSRVVIEDRYSGVRFDVPLKEDRS